MALPNIPGYYDGPVQGALTGITLNGDFFACESTCTLNVAVDFINAASTESGRWREVVPAMRSWDITVEGNLLLTGLGANAPRVMQAIFDGELLDVAFATLSGVSPKLFIGGKAYASGNSLTGPSKGNATWVVTLIGSGPLTMDWELFALIINAMPPAADKPYIVDQTNA